MKKKIYYLLCSVLVLVSCEYQKPAFRFSNFEGTPAERIAKAIKRNDTATIREEIQVKGVNVNFEDKRYEVSLLELALANEKKESFDELLKLGADPNIENSSCVSPLVSAIRYHKNCNLYFIENLIESGAMIIPRLFEQCNYFAHDPIIEAILYHSDEDEVACGLKILKLLTDKLGNPNLLSMYNNEKDRQANIVYACLSTHRNIPALKYLIVDLGYEVPEQVFINGTILPQHHGYKSLRYVLSHPNYVFTNSPYREKAKQEILSYLDEKGIK